eukprot:GHRQ01029484.1.p4 GENE.GHRQ01029484.1~~GHRQ01029484.1.p4  ORF type:complete len:123 (-),score=15.14 GHRQ01029484.1:611-979(-)
MFSVCSALCYSRRSLVLKPQVSAEMGLPYREGLVKNRYVGRTFIMPDQRMREMSVRRKLNAMPAVFEGRNVLLIDDSIVRGTTMAQIVDMVRKAGARRVSRGHGVAFIILWAARLKRAVSFL